MTSWVWEFEKLQTNVLWKALKLIDVLLKLDFLDINESAHEHLRQHDHTDAATCFSSLAYLISSAVST